MNHTEQKYIPGDPWFICDICGFKTRHSQGRKTWDGLFVCAADYDPKHEQLSPPHIKPKEGKPFPNSRPEPPDQFSEIGDVTPDDL
jgi:hypothetical protein